MSNLESWRQQIDAIDAQLIALLGERFKCTEQIGVHKRENGLLATDPAREAWQMARIAELSIAHSIAPDLTQQIFRLILNQVVENHQKLGAPQSGIPKRRQ